MSTGHSDNSDAKTDCRSELVAKRLVLTDEVKAVSKDLNSFREKNAEVKREIAGILKDGKVSFWYIENSTQLMRFWAVFMDRVRLTFKILRDSAKHAKLSDISSSHILTHGAFCTLEVKTTKSSDLEVVIVNLSNKLKGIQILPDSIGSESSKKAFFTKAEWLASHMYDKNEITDIVFGTATDVSCDKFDLPVNDELYLYKVKEVLRPQNEEENSSERETLMWFFKANTISDSERKKLWKTKIGNPLGITSEQFEILKYRLTRDGIKKSVDKLICDDLNRTLPDYREYEAGESMYENVKLLLSLWQVYRPDIGYVQGMSYLMVMLFYYFEGYECFTLFANLILTKDIMYRSFSFNLDYVVAVD